MIYKKSVLEFAEMYIKILFLSLFLLSCNNTDLKNDIQSFGGYYRNNNYQKGGSLYSRYFNEIEIKTEEFKGFRGRPLALPVQRFVSCVNDGGVVLVQAERVIWKYIEEGSYPITSFVFCDEYIFFINSKNELMKISLDGEFSKRVTLGSQAKLFSEILVVAGELYISSYDGYLFQFDKDLKLKNSFNNDFNIEGNLSSNGSSILVATSGNRESYLIFDLNLKLKKEMRFDSLASVYTGLVASDELIVGFSYKIENNIRTYYTNVFDKNGNELWISKSNELAKYVTIDNQNNIYISYLQNGIGQNLTKIKKFDKNGKSLWESQVDFQIIDPQICDNENMIFLATKGEEYNLFYFDLKKGKMSYQLFMSESELPNFDLAVYPENQIMMTCRNKPKTINIVNTLIDKL